MKVFSRFVVFGLIALLVLATSPSHAQTVTGTIIGSVLDPSGALVANAQISLINEATGDKRDQRAGTDGGFVINAVFPGRYTIRVEAPGFKRLDRTGLNVSASERANLGALSLEVGATTDSVTVTAEGALVQASSAERSAQLTNEQLTNLASSGRTVLGLLRVLPGIPNPGEGGGLPNVNGLRSAFVGMTTDGTPNLELGTAFSSTRPHLDAVAEVKVLTNNYQAEYGGTAGALVQIVTKSGSNDFHGSAYVYRQHESFNANSFFNNLNRVPRAISRNKVLGYTIGGPAYIPGVFNSNKNKLFFFVTQEFRSLPFQNGLRTRTVPTDLERAGNFSQTLDTGNRVVSILDPANNRVQFPGNIIPTSRLNADAQKLFSIFPQPNFSNRAVSGGAYNYTVQYPGQNPRRQTVARVDYNVTDKVRLYVRGLRELNREYGWQYQDTTPRILGLNYIPKNDVGVNSTQVISSTLVNEVLVGMHHRSEYRSVAPESDPLLRDSGPALEAYTRSKLSVNFPTLFNTNAYNVLPNLNYGTEVPSAMALAWSAGGYFPPTTTERALVFNDTLSKVFTKHTVKVGIAIQHRFRANTGNGSAAGSFNFGRNTSNPLDANYGYANSLLGNFTQYSESTSTPLTKDTQVAYEWFVQDNFKASKKLTLDYGVRFAWATPWAQRDGKASNFISQLWTAGNAPLLYIPALNASNARVARNPVTGEFAPAPQIGALVTGSGNPANGIALASDTKYPKGFLENQGILVGPRVGVAYDVFGDGKTALRVGAGMFYQTQASNTDTVFVTNPPLQYTPNIYFGNFSDYYRATGVLFPSAARGFQAAGQAPTVYNYSFGIQRDIGFSTILDVAYVGNQSRHNAQNTNINLLPYGARFQASAQDPTRAAGTPLPDDFLRPYRGFGNITVGDRTGNSNYNALQVQANRKFAKGMQFGGSWTWSKSMAYDDNLPTYQNARFWSYGRTNFDFTHIVVINWLWDIPNASKIWDNGFTRALLNDWNLSGIATFQSGSPQNITFTTVDGTDLTGGGDGIRVDIAGSPFVSKGERTFYRQLDTSVFRRPAKGTFGNMGRGLLSNPGTNNFDLSLSKDFTVKERLKFRLLFEGFNAFNHTQFSGVDTTARFDINGVLQATTFGRVNAARTPRVGQASLRVTF